MSWPSRMSSDSRGRICVAKCIPAFGITIANRIHTNNPNTIEMDDLEAKQESNKLTRYITEVKAIDAIYINPIRTQAAPSRATMGEDIRMTSPITKMIVTGTLRVISPARSLPSST